MDSFLRDFFFAFRVFYKRPGLTLLAIFALSLSLGMAVTAFSFVNGLFLKPSPFANSERLKEIYLTTEKGDPGSAVPLPLSKAKQLAGLSSLDAVITWYNGTINISGDGKPARYSGAFISPGFLEILGYEPIQGRSFGPRHPREPTESVFLLHEDIWRERFDADPAAIGTTLRLNGRPHRLIGILPAEFRFPHRSEVWVPLNRATYAGPADAEIPVTTLGLQAADAADEELSAELEKAVADWEGPAPRDAGRLHPETRIYDRVYLTRGDRSLLALGMLAVVFILLISCANVANLMIGRALTRGREIAVRTAVGASRIRILRQLLTESFVLSALGGVGGLLLAAWIVDFGTAYNRWDLPYWISFELDGRVFLFTAFTIGLTTMVAGIFPAFQASRANLQEVLKEASPSASGFRMGRLTRILTVTQIAFACALLFGAGLVVRNLLDMSRIEPGYDPASILTMRMGLFPEDYPRERQRDAFFSELLDSVRELPGVQAVGLSSWLGEFGNVRKPVLLPEAADGSASPRREWVYVESVANGQFSCMNMPVRAGRGFLPADGEERPLAAVVNETFARMYLPDDDILGKSIGILTEAGTPEGAQFLDYRIVGIVPPVRVSAFTEAKAAEPVVYVPYTQQPSAFMTLFVRMSAGQSPDRISTSIEEAVLRLDPHLPLYFTKTMETFITEQRTPFRLLGGFLFTMGGMALFLATVGVYGMIVFSVGRRRREIGIRMALGATSWNIVSLVLRQGFLQLGTGILLGTGLAYLLGRLVRDFLSGIRPMDPGIYLGVLAILIGTALLAFFLPARRAARLSPFEALRNE